MARRQAAPGGDSRMQMTYLDQYPRLVAAGALVQRVQR